MRIDQLNQIMPLAGKRAAAFLNPLNSAMTEFGVTSKLNQAAFLATVAHESGQLLYMRELADGSAYEMRADLGNTWPGDGMRYKGRGPIQITGRANYAACGDALGLDLISNPELLEIPENGCRAAGWFWQTHKIAPYAEAGDFDAVSDEVNRGHLVRDANGNRIPGAALGWADRLAFYNKALAVL